MNRFRSALSLVALLGAEGDRTERSRALAKVLGAEDLLIFITDPEVGALIPAKGFLRTLPEASAWKSFLTETVREGHRQAILPFPTTETETSCIGRSADGQTVIVLMGGDVDRDLLDDLVALLPLLSVVFKAEQTVLNAKATTSLARSAARQLRDQAASLEQARRMAHDEVIERRRAEDALQAKALELERSNRDLQQFGAIVSHDLQEPLRMVSSYLSLIERRCSDRLDEKAKEYLTYATSGAERMSRLIKALLSYAQVGVESRIFGMVPLEAAVQEAIINLTQRVAETKAEIQVADLPSIRGDHVLLVQLFQNLISNALKFKGVNPPVICITSDTNGSTWKISVSDNGIGVSQENRERIFGVFQRLHGQDQYEGNGIGLATCRRIVDRHGGRIWVDSELGAGSTFRFTLPKASGSEPRFRSAT